MYSDYVAFNPLLEIQKPKTNLILDHLSLQTLSPT